MLESTPGDCLAYYSNGCGAHVYKCTPIYADHKKTQETATILFDCHEGSEATSMLAIATCGNLPDWHRVMLCIVTDAQLSTAIGLSTIADIQ